jgi:hypothetical protein
MSDLDVYIKTAAGAQALKDRSASLPGRLRTLLIMVDGVRTLAELRVAAAALGAPEDFLETLQRQGWVADIRSARASASKPAPSAETGAPQSEAERFLAAQRYMNETAVDAMGLRVFFFSLKVERCYSATDLLGLLAEFTKHMTKARGAEFAQAASDRVRRLLG